MAVSTPNDAMFEQWIAEDDARHLAFQESGSRSWYQSPVDGTWRSVTGQWSPSELANRMTMGDATPSHEAAAADFWAMAAHQAYVNANYRAEEELQRDVDEETSQSQQAAAEATELVELTGQLLVELQDEADRLNDRADAYVQEMHDAYNARVTEVQAVHERLIDRTLYDSHPYQDDYSDGIWAQAEQLVDAGITSADVDVMTRQRDTYHEEYDDLYEQHKQAEFERERDERKAQMAAEGPVSEAWRAAVAVTYREQVLDYGNDGRIEDDRHLTEAEQATRAAAVGVIAGATGVSPQYVYSELSDAAHAYGQAPGTDYDPDYLAPPDWSTFVENYESLGFEAAPPVDVDAGPLVLEDGTTFTADEPAPVELTEAGEAEALASAWDAQAERMRGDVASDLLAANVEELTGATLTDEIPEALLDRGMSSAELSAELFPEGDAAVGDNLARMEETAGGLPDTWEAKNPDAPWAAHEDTAAAAVAAVGDVSRPLPAELVDAVAAEAAAGAELELAEGERAREEYTDHLLDEALATDPAFAARIADSARSHAEADLGRELEPWEHRAIDEAAREGAELDADDLTRQADVRAWEEGMDAAAQDGDGLDERVDYEAAREALRAQHPEAAAQLDALDRAKVDALEAEAGALRQDLDAGDVPAEQEHAVAEHVQHLEEQAAVARGEWPFESSTPAPAVQAQLDAHRAAWAAVTGDASTLQGTALDTLDVPIVTADDFAELVEQVEAAVREEERLAGADAAADVQEQADLAGSATDYGYEEHFAGWRREHGYEAPTPQAYEAYSAAVDSSREQAVDERVGQPDSDPAGWASLPADVPEWVAEQGSEAVADYVAERADQESVSSSVAGDDEPDREDQAAPSDEAVDAEASRAWLTEEGDLTREPGGGRTEVTEELAAAQGEHGPDAYEQALADPDEDPGTVYDDPEFRAELEALAAARAEAAEAGKSEAAEAVQEAHEATQETVSAQPADAAAPAVSESASESSGDGDGS